MSKNVFFIALRQKGELFSGLKVVTDPADLKKDKTTKPPAKPKPKKPDTEEKAPVTAFRTVIVDFIRSMESYRKFMPMAKWEAITPLARNEWICWVESVKTPEIRQQHVERVGADLKGGKRRPCCWPGCVHRKDKPLSPSQKFLLSKKSKK